MDHRPAPTFLALVRNEKQGLSCIALLWRVLGEPPPDLCAAHLLLDFDGWWQLAGCAVGHFERGSRGRNDVDDERLQRRKASLDPLLVD
jgi:hypothetical protein